MDKFKTYELEGVQYIERLVYPRFRGKITFGELSDIEDIEMIDNCLNPSELASAMRAAGEFLIKGHLKK